MPDPHGGPEDAPTEKPKVEREDHRKKVKEHCKCFKVLTNIGTEIPANIPLNVGTTDDAAAILTFEDANAESLKMVTS